uniref:Uncharacterized protein n=1 Tax=Avena sativa TaxID=4498 RepID=A0ACD5XP41_AVESA
MAEPKAKKITTRSYLTWSSEMDTALLSVLVEHHNNGDHAQNGWKPHVYHACIKHVKEKCNIDITKDNIVGRIKTFDKQYEIITRMLAQSGFGWDWEKNMVMVESDEVWDRYVEANKDARGYRTKVDNIVGRIKTFDKQYEIITRMLAQSGFGWDWEKNMVMVESDEVWDRYVEANKDARGYRTKVVKNWESIVTIYSKDHATGAGARTGAESVQELDSQVVEESHEVPTKRQRTGDAILSMIGKMSTSFDDAMKATEPLPMPKVTPPAEILVALEKVDGLEESDMITAYAKLIVNERLYEASMSLPKKFKKNYLLTLP